MAIRPNFQDPVEIKGDDLIVAGQSDGDPLPDHIRVYLEQGGHVAGAVAGGRVDRLSTAWTATLPSEGFGEGPALAFGVEIRTHPLEVSSWSQVVNVK